eukprot:CAMPEP_0194145692 /NCGR_PEP_ID=MMETSP0152-20130528/18404_1 /TAXON_ID=1049557 /ORGANISM="Thalassiothrix antarctica, Strain L6-D1" /LENGTH=91 /DNA_ID=CAMNT_0038845995 /DNA_START=541 /DNA_END=815 /DNA_ORIENTATION=+
MDVGEDGNLLGSGVCRKLKIVHDKKRFESTLEEGLTTDESSSEEDNAKASLICHNGNCTWKYRQKYDDITQELTGKSSDEKEIYHFYDSFK